MIELNNVVVRVGDRSAGGFTVSVGRMAVEDKAVLLGPNGSGKTTLLRAMAGLIPYSGSIKINGVEVGEARGMLEVSSNLPEIYGMAYYVWGLLEVLEDFKGIDRDEFAGIMKRLNLDLNEIVKRPVFALSAGQSALVRLALALSSRPRVVLIDEPFENVDPARRGVVAKMLLEYGDEGVVVTHELDALRAFKALHAYLMLEGRLYGPIEVGDLLESGVVEGEAQGALLTVSIGGKTYSVVKGGGIRFGEMGSLNRLYGLLE
jgi:ABC-2 type transport system ATP-binding protein